MRCLPAGFLAAADALLVPFVYLAARLMKFVRWNGVSRMPRCKQTLLRVGIFPISDLYYEPQFNYSAVRKPFSEERDLPGINWDCAAQLELLSRLSFAGELLDIPQKRPDNLEYFLNNGFFEAGDAEYWYQLIRLVKPKRIFEVGSGYSSLMALKAIRRNKQDDANYSCKHICIEPYESQWLEAAGVSVIRSKVEEIAPGMFDELEENDVLFIDSSHVIRPQGDVLFEYLEVLPRLGGGVIVHIHDIFSPRNYPQVWLQDDIKFWNEQYLLEALLTNTTSWKIIGALNYLRHNHYEALKAVAPFLTPNSEPGSCYIRKVACCSARLESSG